MTNPIIAITGTTGAQGGAINRAFQEAGWQTRALHRGGDPAAVLEGAAALAVTLPLDYRRGVREAWLAGLLEAAGRAGVGRVVLNLASRPLPGLSHPVAQSLREMEAMALAERVPAAVLRPTVYMDNLLQPWALEGARERGVLAYPVPEGVGVAWISHRSLGAAAVLAATRAEAAGRGFDIAGPAALTGPEVAGLFGQALGRAVGYAAIAPLDFAQALNAAMGAPTGDDIGALYAHLPEVPEAMARGADNAALGLVAESFGAWFARQGIRG